MWLFWFFVAVPLIEIALFIQVGGLIGLWPTLGLVLLSAVIGTALIRSQGARAWYEMQRSIAELRDPTRPMAHGAMILFAGMLLLTPGFFTDTMGLLLLIPQVRDGLMRRIGRRVQMVHPGFDSGPMRREPHRPPFEGGVIDAEYTVEGEGPAQQAQDGHLPPGQGPRSGTQSARPRGGSGWTRQ